MATFTYNAFAAKQGVLVENGGGWTCNGFGSPCTQEVSGDNYGPIIGTAAAGISYSNGAASDMSFEADINLAATEFVGAVSMSYTIKWHAVATFQGGNPSKIDVWTRVGQLDKYPDSVSYTADGTSITHNGVFGNRPGSIVLQIISIPDDFDGASVTLAFSGVSFEIHDVIYGATSAATAPASSSAAGSSIPALSSVGPTLTSTTNSTTFLSNSTSVSGQATIIQIIPSQSLPASESQSHLPSIPSSPGSTSMTTSELTGIIAGSLVGVGLVILALAFWCQWRRRRREGYWEESVSKDERGETLPAPRVANRAPWVPYPYLKRPYSLPPTIIACAIPNDPVENETVGVDLVRPNRPRRYRPRRREGNGSSINVHHPPPPAYSQISPRLTSRASPSLVSTDED